MHPEHGRERGLALREREQALDPRPVAARPGLHAALRDAGAHPIPTGMLAADHGRLPAPAHGDDTTRRLRAVQEGHEVAAGPRGRDHRVQEGTGRPRPEGLADLARSQVDREPDRLHPGHAQGQEPIAVQPARVGDVHARGVDGDGPALRVEDDQGPRDEVAVAPHALDDGGPAAVRRPLDEAELPPRGPQLRDGPCRSVEHHDARPVPRVLRRPVRDDRHQAVITQPRGLPDVEPVGRHAPDRARDRVQGPGRPPFVLASGRLDVRGPGRPIRGGVLPERPGPEPVGLLGLLAGHHEQEPVAVRGPAMVLGDARRARERARLAHRPVVPDVQ